MKKLAYFTLLVIGLTWLNFQMYEGSISHYYFQTQVLGHEGAPAIIPMFIFTALVNYGFICWYVMSQWPEQSSDLHICDSCNVLYNEPQDHCLECGSGVSSLGESPVARVN